MTYGHVKKIKMLGKTPLPPHATGKPRWEGETRELPSQGPEMGKTKRKKRRRIRPRTGLVKTPPPGWRPWRMLQHLGHHPIWLLLRSQTLKCKKNRDALVRVRRQAFKAIVLRKLSKERRISRPDKLAARARAFEKNVQLICPWQTATLTRG